MQSGWVAPLGPIVDAFEAEVAARVGVATRSALSSGTAALHLACSASGRRAGRRRCSSRRITFAATVNAIGYVGAEPVFVDSDEQPGNIDPELLGEAVLRRSRPSGPPRRRGDRRRPASASCADYDAIVPIAADVRRPAGRGRRRGARRARTTAAPPARSGAAAVFSFNGNKAVGAIVEVLGDAEPHGTVVIAGRARPTPASRTRCRGVRLRLPRRALKQVPSCEFFPQQAVRDQRRSAATTSSRRRDAQRGEVGGLPRAPTRRSTRSTRWACRRR